MPLHWDIFCHVVDNFGDIGVCWRLARQLTGEHGLAVRLWVDDLAAFQRLCPEIRADRREQRVLGVEVMRWEHDFAGAVPGEVVVETFACRLPDAFEAAMARRAPKPVWINLDHLSAEAWVEGCHALPSPHPRLPLTKYFFFPGFTERTGGLPRENDLERQRRAFAASPAERGQFLARLGAPGASSSGGTDAGRLLVSLFSYENAALAGLLQAWSDGRRPVLCLASPSRGQADLERFAQRRLAVGDIVRAGRLELRLIPFVPQPDYDRLLWSCDLNFVRGEDSFVRAQWAGKPLLWHIYAQGENAHHAKLSAFLDVWRAGLPGPPAAAMREFSLAWNGIGALTGELWERWLGHFPVLRRHAEKWQKKLMKQQDLASRLVQFCQSRL
ncbi:MAG: elongation factor P maturation arginine rhamnosyltransferase EarP [Candidatus Accumulibacter sp.]|nr:elongation factor P maturation arginine rhamnosyltransferase EarP [Accumulibacter sp.]